MKSPIHAMLWEIWRVTRGEIAVRLALGIVGGLLVLAWCAVSATSENAKGAENIKDFGAAIALVLLVVPHFIGWAFLARLNGGRLGFPLYLHFTRPVRTVVVVGLLMAYLVAVPTAIYLASALLLRVISGYPFPLLPVAAWIAALTLIYLALAWSNRSRVIQQLVMMVVSSGWIFLFVHRLTAVELEGGYDWPPRLWPELFDFPLSDYVLIAVVGLASFGIAVAGVARQRRGDAPAAWTPGTGFPEWLVNLFRFPCPTSSATRAQVWFELKSRGLPVLTIAVVLAIANPLVFAACRAIEAISSDGIAELIASSLVGVACLASAITAIGIGAINTFGIRWKQAGLLLDATQPYGTARLVVLKVLVRSICMLTALIVLGVSLWTTFALVPLSISDKIGSRLEIADVPLSSWLHSIEGSVAALGGYDLFALALLVAIGVVVWVTTLAVLFALMMRYRHVVTAALLSLVYGLVLGLLALAEQKGLVSAFLVDAIFVATRWILAGATVFAIAYLFWSGFAERVLTAGYACGTVVISAVFAVAWLTLRAGGAQFAGMPATNAASMAWPLFLPLIVGVLAPWSLNRIRHW